jgi:hypothetical protein
LKLIEPDSAYRLVWTSLFWISIPLMAWALERRWRAVGRTRGVLVVTIAGVIAVLAFPQELRGLPNVFVSKVPYLLTPLEEVR